MTAFTHLAKLLKLPTVTLLEGAFATGHGGVGGCENGIPGHEQNTNLKTHRIDLSK